MEKSIKKIDSHQHFWQLSRGDYHWLTPTLDALYKDFTPTHLHQHLKEHNVEYTITVQAAATLEESLYLLSLADSHKWIGGVVGWVNFDSTKVFEQLNHLAQHSKFKGVRPMLQDIPNTQWILNPKFNAIFSELENNNVCFDALITPKHLKNLKPLLQKHNNLKAVIDHGAKPGIRPSEFDAWAKDIKDIAQSTNTFCKISGLLTQCHGNLDFIELEPYLQHLLECFGTKRLMWGSDWPVLHLASTYNFWVNTTKTFLNSLSQSEQQDIWYNSANHFYDIGCK